MGFHAFIVNFSSNVIHNLAEFFYFELLSQSTYKLKSDKKEVLIMV